MIKAPEAPTRIISSDNCNGVAGQRHYWHWLWVDGVWQGRLACSTCSKEKEAKKVGEIE